MRNLTMNVDEYELSMMQTFWETGKANNPAVFEMYFRTNPFHNGFAIFVGLHQLINYVNNLHFSKDDIAYLKSTGDFDPKFLKYLSQYHFKGTIRTPYEGDLVFANEPIVQVEAPLFEGQLLETSILNMVNYQTLTATKASRIRRAAGNRPLMEFGTRRAQEVDAALWGTRAAYIGGFNSTSNVLAGQKFHIPVAGTFAHALVEAYGSDYAAFKAYAKTHKHCVFLVDTFDTLRSGVPTAIKVANEFKDDPNFEFDGVRLDSGDMAYLSKNVRQMLDKAGYHNAKIVSSDGLDEHVITDLDMQKAQIDAFGVGTKLITDFDQPNLGGVYKLVAIKRNGKLHNTMKMSNNPAKMTTPGKKQAWRITRKSDGKSEGDYITLASEDDPNKLDTLHMFHPQYTYVHKDLADFKATPLLKTIFKDGKQVYHSPSIKTIKDHCKSQLASLWPEYKRNLNPQRYPVDLSQHCWNVKQATINRIHKTFEI